MATSKRRRSFLLFVASVSAAAPASAHFKLMKPTSWLKEDQSAIGGGGPQKGGQPIPTSGVVTEFHAGDTIDVEWIDTIAHPGHFRIALAGDRDDLKNPTIVQDASCNYDESMVPKAASGNVLADGVFFRSRTGFNDAAGKTFTTRVTLPDEPCDKCTLQVMQVMESDIKALSNCYYFHCADIRILPRGQVSSAGGAPGNEPSNSSGGMLGAPGPGSGGGFGFGGAASAGGMAALPPTGPGGAIGGGGMNTYVSVPGIAGAGLLPGAGGATGEPASGSASGGTAPILGATMSSASQDARCALGSRRAGSTTTAEVWLVLAMLGWTRRHRW
jgi:hypothetical protein